MRKLYFAWGGLLLGNSNVQLCVLLFLVLNFRICN